MGWGPEAREAVYNFYLEGLPERQIVGVLRKEWSVDDKTVRRCLTGLDLIDQKTESADWNKDRFERLGGTELYLVNLRRAYAAYKRRQLGYNSGGNTDEHKKILITPLTDLLGIGPLDIHDLDLATFYSRPSEPSWPIAMARVWRELNGGLSVRLDAENKLVWTYLQQHLVDDQVWPAIEDWKIDIATDFLARMAFLGTVVRRIEDVPDSRGLGWPVILQTGSTFLQLSEEQGRAAVSLYYAFRLYDQALSRHLELNHGGFRKKDFMRVGKYQVDVGGNPVAWCLTPEHREEPIDYFLEAQKDLMSLPEIRAAGEAYRSAEETTTVVKGHVERLRLAVDFPPGSVCDACREWVMPSGRDSP